MNKLHQWKFGPNGYQCQRCGVIWREVDGRPANGDCPNAALAEPPSEGYPPLPSPTDLLQVTWRGDREFVRPVGDYFTADQMRAYVDAARAQRAPLTKAEITACLNEADTHKTGVFMRVHETTLEALVRAIERAHKIGGNHE